jgi:hypothetical protein
MRRFASWLNRVTENPPWYLRLAFVPLFAGMALGVAARRGWVVGSVAAVSYGGLGLAMAVAPGGVVDWSRRHPRVDGSFFGPLLFLGLAYLTSLPIWACVAAGIAGLGFGVLMGIRRERRIGLSE